MEGPRDPTPPIPPCARVRTRRCSGLEQTGLGASATKPKVSQESMRGYVTYGARKAKPAVSLSAVGRDWRPTNGARPAGVVPGSDAMEIPVGHSRGEAGFVPECNPHGHVCVANNGNE